MAQDHAADAPDQVSTPKSAANGTKVCSRVLAEHKADHVQMSIEETRARVVENRKQQIRYVSMDSWGSNVLISKVNLGNSSSFAL